MKVKEVSPSKYWTTMITCTIAFAQSTIVGLIMDRHMAIWKLGWNLELLTIVYSVSIDLNLCTIVYSISTDICWKKLWSFISYIKLNIHHISLGNASYSSNILLTYMGNFQARTELSPYVQSPGVGFCSDIRSPHPRNRDPSWSVSINNFVVFLIILVDLISMVFIWFQDIRNDLDNIGVIFICVGQK